MMIRRTLEIASKAYLRSHLKQLIIQNDEGEHQVPFEDIGVLILDNHQITCSQSVLRHCARENIALIVTDERHLPTSQILSHDVHSTQGSIMRMQALTPESVQRDLWQQIIQAKINAQSAVLAAARGIENARLQRLAKTVLPGDSKNHEAQASRIYFKALFGEDFRRNQTGTDDMNLFLNYGYSLIRAACARALMGAGLHPAFGIHHHNQYNVFCLADDVMEPLRPLVDRAAINLVQENGASAGLNRDTKNSLLAVLNVPVTLKKRELPLMSSLVMYCASVRKILKNHKGKLSIPAVV